MCIYRHIAAFRGFTPCAAMRRGYTDASSKPNTTKCVDEESKDEPISQRAGGCCEPVVGGPECHLRAVRRERCAAHPDDLRRHAGQVAWTGDSVISPIRAWPHRRFGAGRRIAPFLLRSWCRLSAAGFFYARKRGLVERTQGVDLAGRGQGHRPAESGCGHAEGAASWKKGSDTCN